MRTVDMHSHTDFSDGQLSPQALVEAALAAGLTALGITDHDTMAGLVGLESPPGLEIVPGIERKAHWHGTEIHILGYEGDWETLRRGPHLERDRADRNAALVEKHNHNDPIAFGDKVRAFLLQ